VVFTKLTMKFLHCKISTQGGKTAFLEESKSTVVVLHVVHDGATGIVHLMLKLVSVDFVVVRVSWLAHLVLDEVLILILETVWSDNNHVNSIISTMNSLGNAISSSGTIAEFGCFLEMVDIPLLVGDNDEAGAAVA